MTALFLLILATGIAPLVAGLLLVVAKLVLASAQQVYLSPPSEAGLDDMLMYNGAVSITDGEWLGAYDWTTLAKYRFFSLWLAGLHALGVPGVERVGAFDRRNGCLELLLIEPCHAISPFFRKSQQCASPVAL